MEVESRSALVWGLYGGVCGHLHASTVLHPVRTGQEVEWIQGRAGRIGEEDY